ncbi:MAG: efflux RND transporter permease subunit [Chloroflexi bacterium]|nr:efflux RND transporter permease subunit [Chloroflexota bacterium]
MSAPNRRWRLPPLLYPLALMGAVLAALLAYLSRPRRRRPRPPAAGPQAAQAAPPAPAQVETLGLLGGITRLSLVRRPVVFLAAAVVALIGVFSALDMRQELFPDIDFPAVTVISRYQGAAPESVVDQVTEPVEAAISNVDGLKRLQSTTAEGVSLVVAEFDFGAGTEEKERQIASALERVDLPSGAEDPTVARIDFGDFPIIAITVWGGDSPQALEAVVGDTVVPALKRIDGVFTVSVTGEQEQLLTISLDPERMAELGVSVNDVALTLSGSGISAPSGFVLEEGLTLPVRTVEPLTSPQQIAELPLVRAAPAPPAGDTRLGDFARVDLLPSPTAAIARTNGQSSLALGVFKAKEANTVRVANEVERTLDRLQGELPENVHAAILFDQSTLIEQSIDSLVREGVLGAAFAVAIILLFLLSVRATLVTAVSIPLSMLAAIAVLNWQGVTLNIMTLGGLTIAVGRVVDDSIVVLENIYVHARRGQPLVRAALDGTREVSTAILSSTLTTVAVFLPLAFIGGIVQESFLPLALAVTFALLASLLVALTVVPALSLILLPAMRLNEGETWLQRLYTPVLRWCLGHRAMTLIAAGAVFVGSFAALPFIHFSFLPGAGWDVVAGRIELPAGTPLSVTATRAEEIEAAFAQMDSVKDYELIIGQTDINNPGSFRGGIPGSNTIDVVLTYEKGADLDQEAAGVRDLLNGFPDVKATIRVIQPGFDTDRVEITVNGDSAAAVASTASEITERLHGISDLENIDNDVAESAPELLVKVDAEQAARYGVTPGQLALEIRRLLLGLPLGSIQIDGRPVPAVLRVDGGQGFAAESFGQLALGLPGRPHLEDLAELETAQGPATVTRVDQRRAATITANIMGTDLADVSSRVDDVVASVEREPGVEVRVGGIFAQQEEAFSDLYLAMAIGVLVVYLVMVASLGSLANPLIILFSLPFVSIGSFLALLVTGRDLGLPALMGLLMLIGIVVTNAIVLITFVEMLRGRGLPPREALIEGARSRVRPILMTALATIFALVPLALGLGQGLIIASELATVVIGGLFTSTLLTLVVIPVIYSLYSDAARRLAARGGKAAD